MKSRALIIFLSCLTLLSCQEKSLQKYLVEKQDDKNFLKVDLAPGMLEGFRSNLDADQQETLSSVKKINLIAYKIHDGNLNEYKEEKKEIEDILTNDKYKDLTRIKSNEWSASFYYTGGETSIDEVIIYASDDSNGFVLGRLLGDKMRPEQLVTLIQAGERGDINFSAIGDVLGVFSK